MMILQKARSMMRRINERSFSRTLLRQTKGQRKELIDSFPEPKDRLERSFFQYQCQKTGTFIPVRFLQNVTAIFLLPVLLWKGYFSKPHMDKAADAVFLDRNDGIGAEIIPASLQTEFSPMVYSHGTSFVSGSEEFRWLRLLCRRYWRAPYFVVNCWMKIVSYAALMTQYHPRAILAYEEFSFTSSVLTDFCESKHVEHINVLHGEKLFNARDSFVSFHRFYVWDERYCDMFLEMRAEPGQFRIELPPALIWKEPEGEKNCYDMTCYLGGQTEKQLQRLYDILEPLRCAGMRICMRIHPRSGKPQFVKKLFAEYPVEQADLPIQRSIARTSAACAGWSTVLLQAEYADRQIVLDDVSDPERYNRLIDLEYPVCRNPHTRLSSLRPENYSRLLNKVGE